MVKLFSKKNNFLKSYSRLVKSNNITCILVLVFLILGFDLWPGMWVHPCMCIIWLKLMCVCVYELGKKRDVVVNISNLISTYMRMLDFWREKPHLWGAIYHLHLSETQEYPHHCCELWPFLINTIPSCSFPIQFTMRCTCIRISIHFNARCICIKISEIHFKKKKKKNWL